MLKKSFIITLIMIASVTVVLHAAKTNGVKKAKAQPTKSMESKVSQTPVTTPDPANPIIAEYLGGAITKADLDKKISKIPPNYQSQYKTTEGMKQVLDMMATEAVFYQKALKNGLDKDPDMVKKIENSQKPLFMQEYYQRNVQNRVKVTENDKRDYYQNNKQKYFENSNTTILYIQTSDLKTADKAKSDIMKGMSFADAVKNYSTNKYSKDLGGKIKNIRNNGYIPGIGNDAKLDSLILAAPADSTKLVGPVQTPTGVHLFKVMSRVEGHQKTYEEVSADIENRVRPLKENELTKAVTDSLRLAYKVKINKSILDSLNMKNSQVSPAIQKAKIIESSIPQLEVTGADFLSSFASLSPQEQMMYMKGNGKEQYADMYLTKNLFTYEAQKLGYQKYLEGKDEYDQARRYTLLQQIYKTLVLDQIKIDKESLQAYYDNNKEKFANLPTRKIQQVVFAKQADAEKAKKKYVALVSKKKDEAINDFVKKMSSKPEQDGVLDNIYKNGIIPGIGQDSTYNKAVWNTPVNAVSDVIKDAKGNYLFFRVMEDRPLTYKAYNEVEPRIEMNLKKEREKELREQTTQQLYQEFQYKKYPEKLETLYSAKELFDMADAAARSAKYKDAVDYYDQIIKRFANGTDDYKAMFMKGFLMAEEMKETDKAIKVFETFLNTYKQGELNESAKFMLEELKNPDKNSDNPIKNLENGKTDSDE